MNIVKDTDVDNKYVLSRLIAKRANDIIRKGITLSEPVETNPVSQAVKEWTEGKFK